MLIQLQMYCVGRETEDETSLKSPIKSCESSSLSLKFNEFWTG